jgi:DNA invertase Pin-like site-specific DNA recombinase
VRAQVDVGIVVGYVRVSTDEQHLSPVAQRDALEAWARARGVHLVAVHEDIGVSGGADLEDCPGLLAAVADVEQRGAGVLLVAKRDRLARDVIKAALVERLVGRAGALVASADGVAEGNDPAAQLMRTMIDAFAQYERAMIRSRVKAALAVKRARGERIGAVPYGFREVEGGRLEPEPREQEAIRLARQLRGLHVRGKPLSLRQVAAGLAAEGFRPRGGGEWMPSTLARMVARQDA